MRLRALDLLERRWLRFRSPGSELPTASRRSRSGCSPGVTSGRTAGIAPRSPAGQSSDLFPRIQCLYSTPLNPLPNRVSWLTAPPTCSPSPHIPDTAHRIGSAPTRTSAADSSGRATPPVPPRGDPRSALPRPEASSARSTSPAPAPSADRPATSGSTVSAPAFGSFAPVPPPAVAPHR